MEYEGIHLDSAVGPRDNSINGDTNGLDG